MAGAISRHFTRGVHGNKMKNKKVMMISLFVVATLMVLSAHAKRGAPKKVLPIVYQGVEYRAPEEHMGMVEAWGVKSNRLIWRRQIYVVKYLELETDVQWVFITKMKANDGSLIIENERGYKYALDLQSLEVKVIKGKSVVIWRDR